jgi:hypothetical protein
MVIVEKLAEYKLAGETEVYMPKTNSEVVCHLIYMLRNIYSLYTNAMIKFSIINKNYPYNRPWRPIGLLDVEAPIFS